MWTLACMLCKWAMSSFFIIFYLDDLILMCNNKENPLQVKEKHFCKFEMKNLGNLHFFLGMEVEKDREQHLFYINQIGISRKF